MRLPRESGCCPAGSSKRAGHSSAVESRDAAYLHPLDGAELTHDPPHPLPQELFTQLEDATSNETSALVVVHWLAHWTDQSKAAQARFSSMCRQLPTVMFVEVAVEASVENKSLALEKVLPLASHRGAVQLGRTGVAGDSGITVLARAGISEADLGVGVVEKRWIASSLNRASNGPHPLRRR